MKAIYVMAGYQKLANFAFKSVTTTLFGICVVGGVLVGLGGVELTKNAIRVSISPHIS